MTRSAKRHGFTLVELMVTVALVGVVAAMSFALLRSKPRAIDVASQISAKIAEASRKAIAGGAVRPDVLNALGSALRRNEARTLVTISVGAGGGTISSARLEEDPLPGTGSTWVGLSTSTLPTSVTISGFRTGADLTGGVTAPATPLAAGSTLEVRCYPDGGCDGMVIYLVGDSGARKARVVVMPLGGSPLTMSDW